MFFIPVYNAFYFLFSHQIAIYDQSALYVQ